MSWLKRRWLDMRNGQIYTNFLFAFSNFVLISYNFAAKEIGLFENLLLFAAIVTALYLPVTILIGWMHRKHQIAVDQEAYILQNPRLAWVWLTQSRIARGVASPQEIEQYEGYLSKIAKKL